MEIEVSKYQYQIDTSCVFRSLKWKGTTTNYADILLCSDLEIL